MMLNIKVQRNKKIKTEKLRNTNMLNKCRNITLAKTHGRQYSVSNRCQLSHELGLTPLSARDVA